MDGPHVHRRAGLGLRRLRLRPLRGLLPAALLLAAPVAVSSGPAASPGEAPQAGRWHFSYAAPPPFRISVLFRRGASGDETRLLVAGPPGKLELLSTQRPEGDDSEETIVDPEGGERFSRRIHLPSSRRPAECAAIREMDGCLTFTGKFGERTVPLSGFVPGPEGDRLRASVSALATERLAARIASFAPLFPRTAEFDRYGDDFLSLVWPTLAWKRPRATEQPRRGPGCSFDASFGYPCTDREREAEEKQFSAAPRRSR